MSLKPVLIFAYGNISRGDDALAPLLLEYLQKDNIVQSCGHPIRYLCDYQIQIEHILDLQDCERVLLIDAHQALDRPYAFKTVTAQMETSYTTHGMTPATLLHTFESTLEIPAPKTSLLAIQGRDFNLGEPLSDLAEENLSLAYEFCLNILNHADFKNWDDLIIN